MRNIIIIILSLIFLNKPLYADDIIMAGFNFNTNKTSFFIKFDKERNIVQNFNKDHNIGIKLDFDIKNNKEKYLAYSGYQNVEGYKNNKSRDDKVFAGSAIAVAGLTIIAGALTLDAILKAID